jgi:hypothetical protein
VIAPNLLPALSGRLGKRLILDSRILGDQQLNERMQQRFAPFSGMVHKLEEPQVEWEFLL